MSEDLNAAPSEAADAEDITTTTSGQQAEAAPPAEAVKQAEPDPAEDDDSDPERKTKSALRREREKQAKEALRERAEKAEAEAARLRALMEKDKKPTAAEITDPDELVAALAAWGARQGIREDRIAEASETLAQVRRAERLEREQAFSAQAKVLAEANPDFDAAMQVAADSRFVSQALSEMIFESDAAAQIALHLGRNPMVAMEISRMGPLAQAREIARLEAQFSLPKPKTATTAPPPVRTVSPSGTATKSPGEMSFKEFKAFRESGGKVTPIA